MSSGRTGSRSGMKDTHERVMLRTITAYYAIAEDRLPVVAVPSRSIAVVDQRPGALGVYVRSDEPEKVAPMTWTELRWTRGICLS